jgi:carbohydrate diacid regulator
MVLTYHLGQRIVDWLAISFSAVASVAGQDARIIASSSPRLVGCVHPLARRAIVSGEVSEDGDTAWAGISIPIVHATAAIGAIVLDDTSPRGREVAVVARTLAELLICQMTVADPFARQRWAQAKFVYDLLHGRLDRSPEAALQEAACLGIDLSIPRAVVVIDIKQAIDQDALCDWADAVLPLITHMLRVERSHAALVELARRAIGASDLDIYSSIGDRWLAILAVADRALAGGRRQSIDHDVQQFLDDLVRSHGITTSAGIGHAYPGWPALAQSFADARFALETGARLHGAGRVFRVEALGLAGFIGSDDRRMKEELAQRLIRPISAEPDLLATLDAFLRAHLSPSLAAQVLHIHRHTLTYRLAKIAQVSGRDPRRFEDAAELYAALMLWTMRAPSRAMGQTVQK